MEQALAGEDFAALVELDRRFRFTIYDTSFQSVLGGILSSLWDRASLYRRLYTHSTADGQQMLALYREIYTACQRHDAAAASRAVGEDIRQTTQEMLKRLGDGQ
ncbi:MAG: hypothetical protein Kow0063_23810 [Anaerolineae bacterium]